MSERADKIMMFTGGVSSEDLRKRIETRSTHLNSDPCEDDCLHCLEERRSLIAWLAEESTDD